MAQLTVSSELALSMPLLDDCIEMIRQQNVKDQRFNHSVQKKGSTLISSRDQTTTVAEIQKEEEDILEAACGLLEDYEKPGVVTTSQFMESFGPLLYQMNSNNFFQNDVQVQSDFDTNTMTKEKYQQINTAGQQREAVSSTTEKTLQHQKPISELGSRADNSTSVCDIHNANLPTQKPAKDQAVPVFDRKQPIESIKIENVKTFNQTVQYQAHQTPIQVLHNFIDCSTGVYNKHQENQNAASTTQRPIESVKCFERSNNNREDQLSTSCNGTSKQDLTVQKHNSKKEKSAKRKKSRNQSSTSSGSSTGIKSFDEANEGTCPYRTHQAPIQNLNVFRSVSTSTYDHQNAASTNQKPIADKARSVFNTKEQAVSVNKEGVKSFDNIETVKEEQPSTTYNDIPKQDLPGQKCNPKKEKSIKRKKSRNQSSTSSDSNRSVKSFKETFPHQIHQVPIQKLNTFGSSSASVYYNQNRASTNQKPVADQTKPVFNTKEQTVSVNTEDVKSFNKVENNKEKQPLKTYNGIPKQDLVDQKCNPKKEKSVKRKKSRNQSSTSSASSTGVKSFNETSEEAFPNQTHQASIQKLNAFGSSFTKPVAGQKCYLKKENSVKRKKSRNQSSTSSASSTGVKSFDETSEETFQHLTHQASIQKLNAFGFSFTKPVAGQKCTSKKEKGVKRKKSGNQSSTSSAISTSVKSFDETSKDTFRHQNLLGPSSTSVYQYGASTNKKPIASQTGAIFNTKQQTISAKSFDKRENNKENQPSTSSNNTPTQDLAVQKSNPARKNAIQKKKPKPQSTASKDLWKRIQDAQLKPNYFLSLYHFYENSQRQYQFTSELKYRIEYEIIEAALDRLLLIRATMMRDQSKTSTDMLDEMKMFIRHLKEQRMKCDTLYQHTQNLNPTYLYRNELDGINTAINNLEIVYEEMKVDQKKLNNLLYQRVFQFVAKHKRTVSIM